MSDVFCAHYKANRQGRQEYNEFYNMNRSHAPAPCFSWMVEESKTARQISYKNLVAHASGPLRTLAGFLRATLAGRFRSVACVDATYSDAIRPFVILNVTAATHFPSAISILLWNGKLQVQPREFVLYLSLIKVCGVFRDLFGDFREVFGEIPFLITRHILCLYALGLFPVYFLKALSNVRMSPKPAAEPT
jgi:hypothetical protein